MNVTMAAARTEEVRQLLYREARLLDEGLFEKWLTLFTEDALYWAPIGTTGTSSGGEVDDELGYFEDNKQTLTLRVQRLFTGSAWAENPRSSTRRIIGNIEVDESEDGLVARSNFVLYSVREGAPVDLFTGARRDVLRPESDGLRITMRRVSVDGGTLRANNLSTFL